MKIIRNILCVFVLSIFFALSGVNADVTLGFNEISIPALNGTYQSAQMTKTRASNDYQSLYTVRMDKNIKARLFAYYNHMFYDEWVNGIVGYDVYFNNDSEFKAPGQYRIDIKAINYNVLAFKYWGVWTYDPV